LLLAKGADPNIPGRSGVTPLAAAAFKGNDRIVEDLLARGAHPNLMDATGKAAITYAAARGFAGLVSRLLDAGVDPGFRYGHDLTALMWAAGHEEGVGPQAAESTAAVLIGHGAPLDTMDDRGRTALMVAAELGYPEMVTMLIKQGADRKLRDKAGRTAFDLAIQESVRRILSGETR
jgi:uncharacterized protein